MNLSHTSGTIVCLPLKSDTTINKTQDLFEDRKSTIDGGGFLGMFWRYCFTLIFIDAAFSFCLCM